MKYHKFLMANFAILSVLAQNINAEVVEEEGKSAEGYLFRHFFGDNLEKNNNIKISGLLQVGFSDNNNTSAEERARGTSNLPVIGPIDEGLQLDSFQIFIDKPIKGNMLPRITPLPGGTPSSPSFGFHVETQYGRHGQPAMMYGFDHDWNINSPGNDNPELAAENRQNFFALPQVYAQLYLPFWQGMGVTLGRFASGVGYEIPPEVRPSPSFFYSRTYAMASQPDQVAGVLTSVNLLRGQKGLLMGEVGIVNGWQNWEDNNSDKSIVGALRWRSPDMKTWIDYSFMTGNEQNSPDVMPQMPTSQVISPKGQNRQHHSLAISHDFDGPLKLAAEILYGSQDGDGKASTVNILSGPGFDGASYSGINGHLIYKASDNLSYGLRAEKFRAKDGFGLFPLTAVSSDFNSVTLGAQYNLNKFVMLRPEIRYDWQSGNDGVDAFGGGTSSSQRTASIDMVVYF
ncbi:MAG: outer membrane beta-barrel protein [Oceanospirillales bacterium]|nr:outer membrane beta-barrel protein [Oceanospirillales bacterium]